jgi:hypothetical protein
LRQQSTGQQGYFSISVTAYVPANILLQMLEPSHPVKQPACSPKQHVSCFVNNLNDAFSIDGDDGSFVIHAPSEPFKRSNLQTYRPKHQSSPPCWTVITAVVLSFCTHAFEYTGNISFFVAVAAAGTSADGAALPGLWVDYLMASKQLLLRLI